MEQNPAETTKGKRNPSLKNNSEMDKILSILRNNEFFKQRNINEEDLNIVAQGLTFEEMEDEEYVFHEGSLGDKFYIILKGAVKVFVPIRDKTKPKDEKKGSIFNQTEIVPKRTRRLSRYPTKNLDTAVVETVSNNMSPSPGLDDIEEVEYKEVATLKEDAAFGELALINDKPRAATIQWCEPTTFAVLTKADYKKVFLAIEKKIQNQKIQFLKSIPYFSKWTSMALSKFAYYFTDKHYIRNQVVFKEGQKWDNIYIVKSGEFELTKSKCR